MIETKVVKVSLVVLVEEAIKQTCDIYGADGWRLGGVVWGGGLHYALLIFQRDSNPKPTTTSDQSPS